MLQRTNYLGHYQEWGQDEVRILTERGYVICRKGKELYLELSNIESRVRSSPILQTNSIYPN